MKKLILIMTMLFILPISANAESNYEFYFFGINVKSLKGSNWVKVTIGAVTSVLVHELGHALYLESQDKEWEFRSSFPSLSIYTDDNLSYRQNRNFGMAGFALQSSIGFLLTSFEKTRQSDFTKGWVGINTFQVYSYNLRNNNSGDFALIDEGRGDSGGKQVAFCFVSSYNLARTLMEVLK